MLDWIINEDKTAFLPVSDKSLEINWDSRISEEVAYGLGIRFANMAGTLPKEAPLCWQIESRGNETFTNRAFLHPDSRNSSEDLSWIFRLVKDKENLIIRSASEEPDRNSEESSSEENQHLYVLCSARRTDEQVRKARFYGWEEKKDKFGSAVEELMKDLRKESFAIRFLAEYVEEVRMTSGLIAMAMPYEMTLPLRAGFAEAFPELRLVELSEIIGRENRSIYIPEEVLVRHMSAFLTLLDYNDTSAEENQIDDYGYGDEEMDAMIDEIVHDSSLEDSGYSDQEIAMLRQAWTQMSIERDEKAKKTAESEKKTEEQNEVIPQRIAAETKLQNMIGLTNVKARIRKIISLARLRKFMETNNPESTLSGSLHMAFLGNPGTAKTTVARYLAEILYEYKVTSKPDIVEVGRADLVGGYVGQTAPKVTKAFEKAKGGVLFIDEAYSLVDNRSHSFGDEAITAIIAQMENNRDDTIVIFAGYPDEMKEFFARNVGMRSRVNFKIEFPDYSVDEMMEITTSILHENGFSVREDAVEKMRELCKVGTSDPENGNGRFCRNIAELAIMNYAEREFGEKSETTEETSVPKLELIPDDFVLPDGFIPETHKKNQWGFIRE